MAEGAGLGKQGRLTPRRAADEKACMRGIGIIAPCLAAGLAACSPSQARQEPAPPALDLSGTIALRDATECRFDALTEHAFDGLLLIGPDEVTSAPVVALGQGRFAPQFTSETMEGAPEGREYRSHVALPAGSTWHDLPLKTQWAEFVAPPETDSLYRRGLTFAATAEQVRAALAAQGADVPIAPKYRELGEFAAFSAGTCGGSIMIEPHQGGAALVCDRGC
jgi:hypothetical protein